MNHYALQNAKVIPGTGSAPIEEGTVLLEGAKITYAGTAVPVPAGYELIDCTGKTVLPGLIDSHLHFTGNESDDDTQWVLDDPTYQTVVAVQQARDALESGLTTVAEISRSGVQIRNAIEAGIMRGPRMICTGRGFCRTGGHGDSHRLL